MGSRTSGRGLPLIDAEPGDAGRTIGAPASQFDDRASRFRIFLIIMGMVALVVALARRPPILDLPLLFEQLDSFEAVLAGDRPDLVIDWPGPNRLGVVPVAIARHIAPVPWAPRLAVLLLACIWIGSMHAVAAMIGRPVAAAILVTPLLFGSALYSGLFTFLCGVAALPYWTWALEESRRRRGFVFLASTTMGGALLLYLAHITWLIAGGFAVASFVLLHRFNLREAAARVVGVVPVAALALTWAGGWTAGNWQGGVRMVVEPLARVTRLEVASSLAMGGLQHSVERVILVTCCGWLLLALVRAIRERGAGVHWFLMSCGCIFLAVALLAPEQVDKMVLVAWRWGGVGLAVMILALPQPRVDPRLLLALASVLLCTLLAVTAAAWAMYARRDLDGFESALAAVPPGARLFSVDLDRVSPEFRAVSTLHLYAWAAAERDARIDSTFTDTGNGLVRWADPASRIPLAEFLLWRTAYLRPVDLRRYTHVLVHAPPGVGSAWAATTGVLDRVHGSGRWALFAVVGSAGVD